MAGTCQQCGVCFATKWGALDHWKRTGHDSAAYQEPVKVVQVACPRAVPYGTDEFKCPQCGRIWDRNEPRPDCKEDI